MRITINRFYSANDICRGRISVEGFPELSMLTLEPALPRNLDKYVGHALPPGEYRCMVDVLPVDYKGLTLRLPWICLCDVQWFPHARFVQKEQRGMPRLAQIFIGAEYTDNGFTITNPNDEAMKMWAKISMAAFGSKEDITLVIQHDDLLVFEDTYKDKARLEAEERAEALHREQLMQELFS